MFLLAETSIAQMPWAQFGALGVVCGALFWWIRTMHTSHTTERKEWKEDSKTEREEWRGEIKSIHKETQEQAKETREQSRNLEKVVSELTVCVKETFKGK